MNLELKAVVNKYNDNLDNGINDSQQKAFISVIIDIRTDIEHQIKEISESYQLLNGLNIDLSSIRFIIQSIKQNDKIILP